VLPIISTCHCRTLWLVFYVAALILPISSYGAASIDWVTNSIQIRAFVEASGADIVPTVETPSHTVYQALKCAYSNDYTGFLSHYDEASHSDCVSEFSKWREVCNDWSELLSVGGAISRDNTLAYVGIAGRGRSLLSTNPSLGFVDVVFLTVSNGVWVITLEVPDQQIQAEVMLDLRREYDPSYDHSVDQEASSIAWMAQIDKDRRESVLASARDDAERSLMIAGRTESERLRSLGVALPVTFSGMMVVYGGEYLTPPLSFSTSQRLIAPNYSNPTSALYSAVCAYAAYSNRTERLNAWGTDGGWMSELKGNPLPDNYTPRFTNATQFHALAQVSFSWRGSEYIVFYGRYQNTINPSDTAIKSVIFPFKFVSGRWQLSRDLKFHPGLVTQVTSLSDVFDFLHFAFPGRQDFGWKQTGQELVDFLATCGFPSQMLRIYNESECLPFP